jgi:hypothetical protein
MDTRQKLAALTAAVREGREIPAEAMLGAAIAPLNNLNYNSGESLTPSRDIKLNPQSVNLNNLKGQGVPRVELYTDEALKKAMAWGVQEWLVQVCIRDYGLHIVKGVINRIYSLPEGYFKPKYGPIPQQRGRLFNTEMKKLREHRSIQNGIVRG